MSYIVEVSPQGLTEFIRNLSRDCSNGQWLREFTKNSFEAIETYRVVMDKTFQGSVLVEYDSKLAESNIFKIQIIDNGIGMTKEELLQFPRQLASTSPEKQKYGTKNYGIGAKISSLTRNHFGIEYKSWRDGKGHAIWLYYDEEKDQYGLKEYIDLNGVEHCIELDRSSRHEIIKDHGTIVTLWGMTKEADTMDNATHALPGSREAWIQQYLNKRYFEIPTFINLKSRDGYFKRGTFNSLRKIKGMKSMLDKNSEFSGTVPLNDADVQWYVLKEDRAGHGREYDKGHTGIVHEGEIFDIQDGRYKQPKFGIGWMNKHIVLHIHPRTDEYHQNVSRNSIAYRGEESLPWPVWQEEFKSNFPDELKLYLDSKLLDDQNESLINIKRQLKDYRKFYPLSQFKKYKLSNSGSIEVDDSNLAAGLTGGDRRGDANISESAKGTNAGFVDDYLSLLKKEGTNLRAKEISDPFPDIHWTREKDGYVTPGEMTDKAAVFRKEQNKVFANSEYAGFVDSIDHFKKEFSNIDEKIIIRAVHDTFGAQLMETVAGIMALEKRPHWAGKPFENAISPEALSVAVSARMHFFKYIKKQIVDQFKNQPEESAEQENNLLDS